jgi:alpha-glucoside transport system substrate-binding protein
VRLSLRRREVIDVKTRLFVLCAAVLGAAMLVAGSTAAPRAARTLSIVGPWTGADAASFQAVLAAFNKAHPGVTVTYTPATGDVAGVLHGTPTSRPDLAVLSLPRHLSEMKTLAAAGTLKSLDFALPRLRANYAYSWQRLGSVNGTLVGLPFKATNRSAIWFDRAAFRRAGIAAPRSRAELLRAMRALSERRMAPFALSGGPISLPNLFQNVYLMLDGSRRYDSLAAGEIAWTGATVRGALLETARLTTGLAGGTGSLSTDYSAAVQKVFGTPARAAMVPGGSAALPVLYRAKAVRPLSQFGVFAFPRVSGDAPRVIGDADVVVMVRASADAQALIDYLATPEAATIWANRGGFYLSPNRGVKGTAYGSPAIRSLAMNLASANVFRLAIADTMPSSFKETFTRMLVQHIRNPAAAAPLLRQLDAARTGA